MHESELAACLYGTEVLSYRNFQIACCLLFRIKEEKFTVTEFIEIEVSGRAVPFSLISCSRYDSSQQYDLCTLFSLTPARTYQIVVSALV